jgi:hypothetical protein
MVTPNLSAFSYNIFIQECVAKNENLLYKAWRGWKDTPSSKVK